MNLIIQTSILASIFGPIFWWSIEKWSKQHWPSEVNQINLFTYHLFFNWYKFVVWSDKDWSLFAINTFQNVCVYDVCVCMYVKCKIIFLFHFDFQILFATKSIHFLILAHLIISQNKASEKKNNFTFQFNLIYWHLIRLYYHLSWPIESIKWQRSLGSTNNKSV